MVMEIGPSKTFNSKAYGAFGIAIVLILGILSLIYIPNNSRQYDNSKMPLLGILCPLVFCMGLLIFLILEMIYIPNGAIIDEELKQVTLKYLGNRQRIIRSDIIDAYKEIRISTRYGYKNGIVIYLANGKPILLSDLNLNDYTPIKRFIVSSNIRSMGEGKFYFPSYFMHQ